MLRNSCSGTTILRTLHRLRWETGTACSVLSPRTRATRTNQTLGTLMSTHAKIELSLWGKINSLQIYCRMQHESGVGFLPMWNWPLRYRVLQATTIQLKCILNMLALFPIHLSFKLLYYLNRILKKRKFYMLSFSLHTFQHRCSSQSQGNRGYKEFGNMKLVRHPLGENKKQIIRIYWTKDYFPHVKQLFYAVW